MGVRSAGVPGCVRDAGFRSLAAAACVTVLVYGVGLGSAGFREAIFWWLLPPLDLAFAVYSHRVCRHPAAKAAERPFWRGMRTAGYLFLLGDVYVGSALLAGRPSGWLPLVDVRTLLITVGVVRVVWATFAHPVQWHGRERLRMWLDLSAALVGGSVFVWYFWLGAADVSPAEFAVTAVLALLMLSAAFGVGKLLLGGEAPFSTVSGIIGGLGALGSAAGAAVPPSMVQTGNADLVHFVWLAPSFALAICPRFHELELHARSGTAEEPEQHPYRVQTWLPYLALTASHGLLIFAIARQGEVDRQTAGVVAGVSAIIGLTMVRQVLVIADNAALVTRLHASLTELAGFHDLLWYEARHDQLTRLANRTLLHERIQSELESTTGSQRIALLLLDLDRFKAVNDTLGHHVGDRLLVHVADWLRSQVRATDTVARLGGDEFVILMPSASERDARSFAHRLQTAFRGSVTIDGHQLDVGVSIGVAAGLLGEADALLRRADADMYRVKRLTAAAT